MREEDGKYHDSMIVVKTQAFEACASRSLKQPRQNTAVSLSRFRTKTTPCPAFMFSPATIVLFHRDNAPIIYTHPLGPDDDPN